MHQLVVIVITMGPHRVWIEHDYVFLDINIMIVYGYGMLIFFTTCGFIHEDTEGLRQANLDLSYRVVN